MSELSKSAIEASVSGKSICREVVFFPTIDSTNSYGLRLLRRAAKDTTLIVADYQSGGRGREQRRWLSATGKALLFSIALVLPADYSGLQFLTLLGAVSVAEVLRESFGLEARIKWPNDVVVAGRKIAGVLTEVAPLATGKHGVVLGIGVNVNQNEKDFEPEIRKKATSVLLATGKDASRLDLLSKIVSRIDAYYGEFLRNERGGILSSCKQLSSTLGRAVSIRTHQGPLVGTAAGIEDDGGLVVRRDTGMAIKIYSGDVEEVEWLE
jgi:BirA family biotin operon repressor/biotin-[acetyl-CoA-carboxylase] ligase